MDRLNLPVYHIKKELENGLRFRKVFTVNGGTGSGKSTQIAQWFLADSENFILVVCPRRIATISLAKRVCEETGTELGDIIGYKIGKEKVVKSNKTRLMFITIGVLIQWMVSPEFNLDFITQLFFDEVHERSKFLDLSLMLLKYRLNQGNHTKLQIFLMSATIQDSYLANYFVNQDLIPLSYSTEIDGNLLTSEIENGAMKITIPLFNQKFHILSINYFANFEPVGFEDSPDFEGNMIEDPNKPLPIFSKQMKQHIFDILVNLPETDLGGVLIFVPSITSMYDIKQFLESKMIETSCGSDWEILELNGSQTDQEQNLVMIPYPMKRKVIISTSVAESGITVPDITYVIDSCLHTEVHFDPKTMNKKVLVKWITRDQSIQRAGRVGRVSDGHVFRLVSESFFNNDEIFKNHITPEILTSNISDLILFIKIYDDDINFEDILNLGLDVPKPRFVKASVDYLRMHGAVNNQLEHKHLKITPFGRFCSSLAMDIKFSKLIYLGFCLGVYPECKKIASIFSSMYDAIKYRKNSKTRYSAYRTLLRFSGKTNKSDHIAVLNMFDDWLNHVSRLETGQNDADWFKKNFVVEKVFREALFIMSEIDSRLKFFSQHYIMLNDQSRENRDFYIKIALAGAFYPNYMDCVRINKDVKPLFVVNHSNVQDQESRYYLDQSRFIEFEVKKLNLNNVSNRKLVIDKLKELFTMLELQTTMIRIANDSKKVFVLFARNASNYYNEFHEGVYLIQKYMQLNGQIQITSQDGTKLGSIFNSHNPNRLKVYGIMRSLHNYPISVDGKGVNCFILDKNYKNNVLAANLTNYKHVMFGSEIVEKSEGENNIHCAVCTTVLDGFNGIIEILLCLFAPKIQFKIPDLSANMLTLQSVNNLTLQKIIKREIMPEEPLNIEAIIAGLGPLYHSPMNHVSGLADDYDIKIPVRCEMTLLDFEIINKIRGYINSFLNEPEKVEWERVHYIREKVKKLFSHWRKEKKVAIDGETGLEKEYQNIRWKGNIKMNELTDYPLPLL